LPPQQSSDDQVDVGGEIRLARCGRTRRGTQHKQATSRQRSQIPARQVPELSANAIPHDRGADRLAHDKTNPGVICPAICRTVLNEQVPGHQRASGPAAHPRGGSEFRTPPHPRSCRKHHHNPRDASDADALAPLPAAG
jgi:hypothetical protein